MTKLQFKEISYDYFLLTKAHLKNVKELDITITGNSMKPLFNEDSQQTKVRYIDDLNLLKRFDVIVFWQGDKLISHYFWKKNEYFQNDNGEPYIITRPLNPIKSFDIPIVSAQILGILPEKIGLGLKLKIFFRQLFN